MGPWRRCISSATHSPAEGLPQAQSFSKEAGEWLSPEASGHSSLQLIARCPGSFKASISLAWVTPSCLAYPEKELELMPEDKFLPLS